MMRNFSGFNSGVEFRHSNWWGNPLQPWRSHCLDLGRPEAHPLGLFHRPIYVSWYGFFFLSFFFFGIIFIGFIESLSTLLIFCFLQCFCWDGFVLCFLLGFLRGLVFSNSKKINQLGYEITKIGPNSPPIPCSHVGCHTVIILSY